MEPAATAPESKEGRPRSRVEFDVTVWVSDPLCAHVTMLPVGMVKEPGSNLHVVLFPGEQVPLSTQKAVKFWATGEGPPKPQACAVYCPAVQV